MPEKLSIDHARTALLVMDYQTLIVDNYASSKDALLGNAAKLLEAARRAKMMVIYVVVGFRGGFPEVSERNKSFSAAKAAGRFGPGDTGVEIHSAVAPQAGEVIVTKHRVSGFAGTDLEMILRANGIETLMLAGIATSGVVLSTLRHAADADYRAIVVRDCCSDRDEEVHRVLVEKVFPRQAAIATCDEVLGLLA